MPAVFPVFWPAKPRTEAGSTEVQVAVPDLSAASVLPVSQKVMSYMLQIGQEAKVHLAARKQHTCRCAS